MPRKQLSNKEIRALASEVMEKFGEEIFDKKSKVEEVDGTYFKDGEAVLIKMGEDKVPSLKLILKNNFLPTVTVDMGAIKFVISGADVMRPGITQMSSFDQGEIVSVVDENNAKPIAVCKALFSSAEIESMDNGKVLKNLHYISDKYWKL